jgi:hypothetical protein
MKPSAAATEPTRHNDGSLLRADSGKHKLDCAYAEQTFRLWRVETGGVLYVELRCGHPYRVRPEDATLSPSGETKLKEMTMTTKKTDSTSMQVQNPALTTANIPAPVPAAPKKANGGALPVPGYEAMVQAYRQKAETLKWIEKEVDSMKTNFRATAQEIAVRNPGVTSLAFQAPDGVVKVSLSDPAAEGNRLLLKPEDVADVAQRGLDLGPHLEVTKSYVLRGDFVEWLDTLLTQWKAQGIEIPDGLEEKVTTRLSAAGAAALKELAGTGNAEAAAVLIRFIKDPSVR